ncbi:precorrin-3B C(17)-methyltransferase [Williamsia herbipolensis]|uniref:Precorrin-3B C(17)-methyltransferase n=1 Tax=Williamsia herbipolensis TaxID=1603258 RepID=A0AAU4K411_9NOCA|nr:precorrin-3B C(17)-methyltransferase [Williamsia herbipolensis]
MSPDRIDAGSGAGKLWGVGLGPGDSELVTVKAARIIAEADVVAYHSARHGRSIALGVATPYLREGQVHEKLVYPVTTGTTDHPGGYRGALEEFYAESAERLAVHLRAGRTVALLAEGDPLFYSSYMHMHKRLVDEFDAEIVPGVTSVSASTAAVGIPWVEADETTTVLPGTMGRDELVRRLRDSDAVAIMKLGRTFPTVLEALETAGLADRAWYVERASTSTQRVVPVRDVDPTSVPYFSMIVVPGVINGVVNHVGSSSAATADPVGGEVVVVGLGPGAQRWTTPEVLDELARATDIVGYKTYLARISPRPGQRMHASDNRVESERACMALDLAAAGARVVVVSSGDPGVFAMASAVVEMSAEAPWTGVTVRVVPGVTAANAVAAAVGAPLGHDYAVISLSDRLKPWDTIERRIRAAVSADLVIAIYNPGSASRTWQVEALRSILLAEVGAERPVIAGRDVGGPEQAVSMTTVGELDPASVDMRTLLIVGSSTTRVVDRPAGAAVFTSRRYGDA